MSVNTFIGIKKKKSLLSKIYKKYQIAKNNVACVGDDINDLEILKQVNFSATSKDRVSIIIKKSDYVCKSNGVEGVLREVTDLIISCQKLN